VCAARVRLGPATERPVRLARAFRSPHPSRSGSDPTPQQCEERACGGVEASSLWGRKLTRAGLSVAGPD
jgi:hypothetical protein